MKFFFLLLLAAISTGYFSFAQTIQPINSRELIEKANQLYDSAQYKQALAIYDKIDRNDTNYVWSLFERALSCEADSQYTRGIKYCEEGLALKAQREHECSLYNEYGNLLNESGEPQKAIEIFDQGLKKYPSSSLLYFNKGIVFLNQKRFEEAEKLFKEALLINPYMYSAHFFLGLSAVNQGKIIPGFLSFIGYLLINPEGRYKSRSINIMDEIAKSNDEIVEFKNKRVIQPNANYSLVEEIVLSKIALEKEYKPLTAIDEPIARQIQVVFEKLEFDEKDTDFCMQYYLPFYKQKFSENKFELFINRLFQGVNLKIIQDYNKKNKKELQAMLEETSNYFNHIRETRELQFKKRDGYSVKYLYDNGELRGKGKLINQDKTYSGSWEFYYPNGNLKAVGNFNDAGNKEGNWIFYHNNGIASEKESYKDGKLEGRVEIFFDNATKSTQETYHNGLLEGVSTNYYLTGAVSSVAHYKLGKLDGEKKTYFSNGQLKYLSNYLGGALTGTSLEYYNTGQLKEKTDYVQGIADGKYKGYYENGNLSGEGQFTKDKAEGDWKYYHENGKLRLERGYINNNIEGLNTEYFDDGQKKATYNYKKGSANGEAMYYDRNGKLYAQFIYENDKPVGAKYFDKAGKQISSSDKKKTGLELDTYNPDGTKKAHYTYDTKGNLTGPGTEFYRSGKIRETNEYTNGEANGLSTAFYRNGKKKSEVSMANGKENGYYKGYFSNGKLQAEGWFVDDVAQGQWIYYDEFGNLSTKAYYLDGEFSGYREEFFADGKKSIQQKYYKGWLEELIQYDSMGNVLIKDSFPNGSGKYLLIYPGGKKMVEGQYVNGDLDGSFTTYYFDGSVESIKYFKKGILDSSYVSFYYGNIKELEGQYKFGKKTGIWKSYDDDGTLSTASTYERDMLNGERIYYQKGRKDFTAQYKNDLRDGKVIKVDTNGNTLYQIRYEDDDAVAYTYPGNTGSLIPEILIEPINGKLKILFSNGKLLREAVYGDGKVIGKDLSYYDNGQLRSIDTADYGVYGGDWKEYYLNGKPRLEYFYVTDNIHGNCKEYDKNGTLIKEMNFFNGSNHGETKYFTETGALRQIRKYYFGKLISVKNEK